MRSEGYYFHTFIWLCIEILINKLCNIGSFWIVTNNLYSHFFKSEPVPYIKKEHQSAFAMEVAREFDPEASRVSSSSSSSSTPGSPPQGINPKLDQSGRINWVMAASLNWGRSYQMPDVSERKRHPGVSSFDISTGFVKTGYSQSQRCH